MRGVGWSDRSALSVNDRVRVWLGRACLVLGTGLLGWWLWVAVDGIAFRERMTRRLDDIPWPGRSRGLVDVARASRREADETGLIGRIEIPRLGISTPVLEGTGGRALRRGVGHVKRTAFPGERGNVGLAGHRDTHFRPLKDVERGDLIRIVTPDGVFAYEVDTILVVRPARAELLDDDGPPRLTLVTCYPFYWVGPAPKRFVVSASPTRRMRADVTPRAAAEAPTRSRAGY